MNDSRPNLTFPQDEVIQSSNPRTIIPVAQEHLYVERVETERIAARVKIRTTHYDVPVAETLQTERLDIERVAIDRIVAEPPQTRTEGDVLIIPVVEEVLVVQYRIVEEVRITSHAGQVDHVETVVLRRQDVTVEDELVDVRLPPTPQG